MSAYNMISSAKTHRNLLWWKLQLKSLIQIQMMYIGQHCESTFKTKHNPESKQDSLRYHLVFINNDDWRNYQLYNTKDVNTGSSDNRSW